MAEAGYFDDPTIQNNPIYELLLRSTDGKSVILSYKEDGTLNKNTRCLMSRLIIKEEKDRQFARVLREKGLHSLIKFSIPVATFKQWSLQIENCFKGETSKVYFNPYHKTDDGRKINSCGILWEHYLYSRRTLFKKHLIRNERSANNLIEPVVFDNNVTNAVEWLNNHTDPENLLKQNWEASYPARKQILADGCSVHDYYEQFACLKTALGPDLLSEDFNLLYPNRENILFDRWYLIKEKIIQSLQDCKALGIEEQVLIRLLPRLLPHDQDAILFYLLPYLISPVPNKRKSGESFGKLSYTERQDAFMIHVQTAAELLPTLEQQRNILRAANLSFQPIPVFVGPLEKLEAVYVYVHDSLEDPTIYKVNSTLHAFDVTFKTFFALRCQYSGRARDIWTFVQLALYNIELPGDRLSRPTQVFLGQLQSWIASSDENWPSN